MLYYLKLKLAFDYSIFKDTMLLCIEENRRIQVIASEIQIPTSPNQDFYLFLYSEVWHSGGSKSFGIRCTWGLLLAFPLIRKESHARHYI